MTRDDDLKVQNLKKTYNQGFFFLERELPLIILLDWCRMYGIILRVTFLEKMREYGKFLSKRLIWLKDIIETVFSSSFYLHLFFFFFFFALCSVLQYGVFFSLYCQGNLLVYR